MPYPSTPLTGSQTFTSLSPLLRQPNHRTILSPPTSCFRDRTTGSTRSPLLSPLHHVISISSALAGDGDYFGVAYEGTTRTPGCTPQVEGGHATHHDFATGLRAMNDATGVGIDLSTLGSVLHLSPNVISKERRKGPGLRISDMPPVILQSMLRGDSDTSTESDGTLKTSDHHQTRHSFAVGLQHHLRGDGVGLGLMLGDEEEEEGYAEEKHGKRRVPTPYPSDRECWIVEGDLEDAETA